MKVSKQLPFQEQTAPFNAPQEGILTLLSILLGEIVIIDVLGL